ncbi:hypothetical protein NDU88_004518 [Pleurodeles waltl]|uniref:Uncharacterized protein n=1 Tax=Pleurodeles waltl TaxID=8319 RepID=A0AAV7VIZ1_PLEWA|nr:hypothetical protein NDU88_004518 [Pleurodeles waltl]
MAHSKSALDPSIIRPARPGRPGAHLVLAIHPPTRELAEAVGGLDLPRIQTRAAPGAQQFGAGSRGLPWRPAEWSGPSAGTRRPPEVAGGLRGGALGLD